MIIGLALLLSAVILLGWMHARRSGDWSFDYVELTRVPIPEMLQSLVFVLLFYGCSVRLAQFPCHGWWPVVAQHGTLATVGVFVIGLKAGIYMLTRFALPLLPDGVAQWGSLAVALGVAGIFYGAVPALTQLGLRRLLAFAAISHTGMLVVGVFFARHRRFAGDLFVVDQSWRGRLRHAVRNPPNPSPCRHRAAAATRRDVRAHTALGADFSDCGVQHHGDARNARFRRGSPAARRGHESARLAYRDRRRCGNVVTAALLLWALQRAFLAERREQRLRVDERPLTRHETALAGIVCAVLIGVGFHTAPWVALLQKPPSATASHYRADPRERRLRGPRPTQRDRGSRLLL